MKFKVLAPATLGVLFWPQAASAGGIGDLLCALLGICGGSGGSTAVPEIDGSAGLAVMAIVACAGAILYRKTRG